jgi:hypothetical protein
MTATHLIADPPGITNGGTVHKIATSLEGTREALEAATALARGRCGRVVAAREQARQATQRQCDNPEAR